MSIELAHRLQGRHVLRERTLREERPRPHPDARTLARIKKKLVITDRLAVFDDRHTLSASS